MKRVSLGLVAGLIIGLAASSIWHKIESSPTIQAKSPSGIKRPIPHKDLEDIVLAKTIQEVRGSLGSPDYAATVEYGTVVWFYYNMIQDAGDQKPSRACLYFKNDRVFRVQKQDW